MFLGLEFGHLDECNELILVELSVVLVESLDKLVEEDCAIVLGVP